jgi:osmotically inducible lipoprotein OsmB
MKVEFAIYLLVLAVLVMLGACTHRQETITGAAAGGVTGAVVAGPIGAAVGAGAGALTAPVVASRFD